MSLNRRYLSRIFKEKMGMSIQEYIVAVRMKEAKRLLSEGFRVFETAQLCGYEDAANFSKIFKRECGLSPAAYRK
jgi:two-component system response regulator YesN